MTETMQTKAAPNCEGIQERLTALLDDELAPEEAAEVRAHLDVCILCRQEREELAAVRDMAGQWPGEAERDLWPAIQSAISPRGLEDVLAELRALRAETQALRREVVELRQELAARPVARPPSRLLFPHGSSPTPPIRQIV